MFRKGTVLFYCPPGDDAIDEAKSYVNSYGLTSENVKIVKRDSGITVEAKTEVELEGNEPGTENTA